MNAGFQRPKGRKGAISALNVGIETLNHAKEVSSITPAKGLFGSVSVILALIRVSFLLVFVDRSQTEMHPGHDGQPGGLCRTRTDLRRRLYHTRPGIEREEIERSG